MRLRSRSVGVGETFYPFKRLPIELRQMIWRFTLEPRVVELRWKATKPVHNLVEDPIELLLNYIEVEEDTDASVGPADDIYYYSLATLPTAFRVCRDSRNAVDVFYPLCFASKTHGPRVKFNLALDTVYLDKFFDQRVERTNGQRVFSPSELRIFGFFLSLNLAEVTGLQNIAISDEAGDDMYVDDPDYYWNQLEALLRLLPAAKNILTVHSVTDILWRFSDACWSNGDDRWRLLEQVADDCYCYDIRRSVELLDDFPAGLVATPGLTAQELLALEAQLGRRGSGGWIGKNTRPVWGRWSIKSQAVLS